MKFVTNSPDTNVLDLCFFQLARKARVEGRKFQQGYLGKQAFWKHVMKTPRLSHKKETMDRCWRLKGARSSNRSLVANGWNDYELPHGYDECKPFETTSPWLEALTFEDAEEVLPCSQSHSSHDRKVQVCARAFPSLCAILL